MNQPQPRPGGHLRLRGDRELPEPVATHRHPMIPITRLCARQLFTYRSDAVPGSWQAVAPVPDLAAAVPSIYNAGVGASHTSYVIHLRRDVYWDTEPARQVTAYDAVRGLKRLCTPFYRSTALAYFTSTIRGMAEYVHGHPDDLGTAAGLAAYANSHEIAGVFVLDDETLVIELSRPALDLVDILAQPCASPVPVEYDAVLPDSAEVRRNLLSTGPYRPVTRAGELVLEHNPAWLPESDPVRHRRLATITVAGDDGAGDADLDLALASGTCPPPGYPGLGLDPYLALNTRGPGPLRTTAARRAVAHAIDRTTAGLADMSGAAVRPAHTIVPPGSDGHHEPSDGVSDHGDPDRARALLAEAGYGSGIRLTVVHPDTLAGATAARAVAADLAKIGVTVGLRPLGFAAHTGVLTDRAGAVAGEWDIVVGAWYPDWLHGNGRAYLLPLCHSGSGANAGGHTDPRVDELIDEAMATQEEPRRASAALREAERRVLADAAVVPVSFRPPRVPAPRRAAVRGVGTLCALGGAADLSVVWLDPSAERDHAEVPS